MKLIFLQTDMLMHRTILPEMHRITQYQNATFVDEWNAL